MLFEAIDKREIITVSDYQVPVLPKLENGLVLLSHMGQHLHSGLGLRQVIDWMLYVRNVLSDEYWYSTFIFHAEKLGLRTLAETVTLFCKEKLGLTRITWCDEADRYLAEEFAKYLFKKGNFGHKEGYGSNTTHTVMHYFRSLPTMFRYLSAAGMVHWEAAHKHRWLRAFAWIYQIGHIVYKGIERKVTPKVLYEEFVESKAEVALLSKLGVIDSFTNK